MSPRFPATLTMSRIVVPCKDHRKYQGIPLRPCGGRCRLWRGGVEGLVAGDEGLDVRGDPLRDKVMAPQDADDEGEREGRVQAQAVAGHARGPALLAVDQHHHVRHLQALVLHYMGEQRSVMRRTPETSTLSSGIYDAAECQARLLSSNNTHGEAACMAH